MGRNYPYIASAYHQLAATMADSSNLESRCERLRSLHVRGEPLLVPNAWDVASARVVEEAGFPVVGTTSAGVAAALGYDDHEGAPAEQMLAAAARIVAGVSVPVTVDAEAGYGLEPGELVSALKEVGAAGCNLEDSEHASGELRDPRAQAGWLQSVRAAASEQGYPLVINARVDVFVRASGPGDAGQAGLLDDALRRAEAYAEAGADCVFPIALWEAAPLERFLSRFPGPVNVLCIPPAPSLSELARLGVARVSWGGGLQRGAMDQLRAVLDSLDD